MCARTFQTHRGGVELRKFQFLECGRKFRTNFFSPPPHPPPAVPPDKKTVCRYQEFFSPPPPWLGHGLCRRASRHFSWEDRADACKPPRAHSAGSLDNPEDKWFRVFGFLLHCFPHSSSSDCWHRLLSHFFATSPWATAPKYDPPPPSSVIFLQQSHCTMEMPETIPNIGRLTGEAGTRKIYNEWKASNPCIFSVDSRFSLLQTSHPPKR